MLTKHANLVGSVAVAVECCIDVGECGEVCYGIRIFCTTDLLESSVVNGMQKKKTMSR